MTNLSNEEFRARLGRLLEEESGHPLRWWYLSFAKEKEGWQGAIVVEAPGFVSAVNLCHLYGISPGGQVKGVLVPVDKAPAPEFTNRLLSKADVERCWNGPVKTIAEWDKERGE